MSDHFDRLLARYAPAGAAGDGPARVRPRLPGPFERIEALRTVPQDPDEPAALIPSAPRSVPGPAERVRHEREVRTDRHTVVRTEAARTAEPELPATRAVPRPEPLLRPVTVRAAEPRPGDAAARPGRRATQDPSGAQQRPPLAAVPPIAAPAAPAAAGPTAARASATASARAAAANGVGRRAPRQAEHVVHVQIGRLEVTAAPPTGAGRTAGARPGSAGRPAPALTLNDYLSRGEKRD